MFQEEIGSKLETKLREKFSLANILHQQGMMMIHMQLFKSSASIIMCCSCLFECQVCNRTVFVHSHCAHSAFSSWFQRKALKNLLCTVGQWTELENCRWMGFRVKTLAAKQTDISLRDQKGVKYLPFIFYNKSKLLCKAQLDSRRLGSRRLKINAKQEIIPPLKKYDSVSCSGKYFPKYQTFPLTVPLLPALPFPKQLDTLLLSDYRQIF